ncbi:hypothetical protein VTN77DRAFT_2929 [Rasamsonia byssochlamydoides]|uniref:uncharacterized protein n=1 Tax=Rasamsonia byssochlamydoides TaxID=89139 RepID=UPI003743BF03
MPPRRRHTGVKAPKRRLFASDMLPSLLPRPPDFGADAASSSRSTGMSSGSMPSANCYRFIDAVIKAAITSHFPHKP